MKVQIFAINARMRTIRHVVFILRTKINAAHHTEGGRVLKKFKFFCSAEAPTIDPYEEIFEFDDAATEEEIREEFREWVFNHLDTAIIPVEE